MSVIGVIGGASGEAIVRQLQKRGYQAALVAGKNGEMGTDIADHVCICDLKDWKSIEAFFRELKIRHIILGTGHRYAFALAGALEEQGFVFNVNLAACRLAKDKNAYKAFLADRGFHTPAFQSIDSREDVPALSVLESTVGLPCVVKAAVDTLLPQKVSSREALAEAIHEVLDSGSAVLVEQFVRGIDITVPVAVAGGRARACGVCYYSKAEECALKGFGRDEYRKEKLSAEAESRVLDYCEKLALASGFQGLPRVDALALPDGRVWVLEVNSVGVTGFAAHHAQYGRWVLQHFLDRGIDLADVTVSAALTKFGLA